MDDGRFIPPDSAASSLVFLGAGESVPVADNGQSITVSSARGTEQPAVEEESYLSKYGTMFVCFVAILGAGTVAAMYVRYKKRQRRKGNAMETTASLDRVEEGDMTNHADERDASRGRKSPPVASPTVDASAGTAGATVASPTVDGFAGNAGAADVASPDSFATDWQEAQDIVSKMSSDELVATGIISRVDVNVVSSAKCSASADEIEVNLPRDNASTVKGWWGKRT
jgi:hypothetical protein